MSRKAIYSVIGILLITGIFLILLAASIILRQPFSQPVSLANTMTPTATEPIQQVSNTPTEMPLLVSTATPSTAPTSQAPTATSTATAYPTRTATQKPTVTSTPEATATVAATLTMVPTIPTATPTGPKPSPTPMPLLPSTSPQAIGPICSQTGISIYLIIGVGVNSQENLYGADIVRYALVNYSLGEIRIVSFPPDLILSSPLLKRFDITEMTIREFYNHIHGNISSTGMQPDVVASNYLAQAISEEFGIIPDHYFSIHSDKFALLIDTTGGIQIDIPAAYREFRPGPQVLDGTQVLEYVRYPDPDLSAQIDRQNSVILSLKDNISDTSLFEAIPLLADQFKNSYTTDLKLDELVKLRCVLRSVPDGNISFFDDIGFAYTTKEPGVGLQPKIDQIRSFLESISTFE